MRRLVPPVALLVPFAIGFLSAAPGLEAAARNIVLIVADDHGRDTGAYGSKAVRTPHLDLLAAEGTRFEFAFCTTASCSPSRATILTGLQGHAHGQYGLQHAAHNFGARQRVRSLPRILKELGYRTARIGKLHVQPEEVFPFNEELIGNPGGARNPVSMAERCRPFIGKEDERPFFLYFCPGDTHRSGNVNQERPEKPDRFGNGPAYAGVTEVSFDPAQVAVPPYLPDLIETRAELAEYYQSIQRLDQGIGKLLDVLRETRRLESTLVVYMSDNGPPFPGAKTTLYEPGTRLPLIVRAPDRKRRGVVSNAMVSWIDIAPTIHAFAGGVPGKEKFHGRSFLAVLEEENPAGWDRVFASHNFHEVTMYYPMRSLRERKFKYTLNLAHGLPFPFASDLYGSATWQAVLRRGDANYGRRTVEAYVRRPREELYDLEADPHETANLASDPAQAKILAEMREKLKTWQKETGDPWAIKYSHEYGAYRRP